MKYIIILSLFFSCSKSGVQSETEASLTEQSIENQKTQMQANSEKKYIEAGIELLIHYKNEATQEDKAEFLAQYSCKLNTDIKEGMQRVTAIKDITNDVFQEMFASEIIYYISLFEDVNGTKQAFTGEYIIKLKEDVSFDEFQAEFQNMFTLRQDMKKQMFLVLVNKTQSIKDLEMSLSHSKSLKYYDKNYFFDSNNLGFK